MYFKHFLLTGFMCLVLLNRFFVMSMTRQQMKNSGKLLKKACMPKNDVTEEQVGDIDKGKFIEDKNVMCYIACVYSMGQVVKNNKIQHDAMIKQVDMMFPADMKVPVKAAIDNCRGVEQVGDIDKGKFIEDKNVMCYIACVYSMGQVVKNNKIQHDAMIKQVDMMFPADMKVPVKAAIDNCRGVAKKYKDICEASFWTAKCMYEVDPSNFVFA